MPLQILGHSLEGLEQSGEDALVGGGDRVRRVHYIQLYRPLIGIDDHLDGIADIAQAQLPERLRVWEICAGRISVLYPEESSLADDEIRVPVQAQEGRDRLHLLSDRASHHDTAVGRNIDG